MKLSNKLEADKAQAELDFILDGVDRSYSERAITYLVVDAEHHNGLLTAQEMNTIIEELSDVLKKYKFRNPSYRDFRWTIERP